MFTNIKCRKTILPNATENCYIILYDLVSRLWYIATCGPFCKDATHIWNTLRSCTLPSSGTLKSYALPIILLFGIHLGAVCSLALVHLGATCMYCLYLEYT